MKWWCVKPHNEVHRLILQALPFFLCWNLWKNRCSSIYGGKKSSGVRVRLAVMRTSTCCFLLHFHILPGH